MQNMIQGFSGGTTCSTRGLFLLGGLAGRIVGITAVECGGDKRSTVQATFACLPR
ncbi:hypothetical protein [Pandoraea anhela]|uniref:hypothetical protein n=1 Tax=Pandoraea anhela TaxID=2508295 RepID=UPI001583FD33|nr:hypothetical protein [Pandoraea anhela]